MDNLMYYLLLTLPFISLIIFKQYSSHRSRNLPPSPPILPLIGHLHLIKNSLHETLVSLSSRYGPIFSLRLGSISLVVVSSPSSIEECFTGNDVVFANRPRSIAGDQLTYDYTAFVWSPYGDLWRTLRRLSVVELFSSHGLQKSAIIREELLAILRALHRISPSRGHRVDLNHLVSTYSFNHMMRVVSGKQCVGDKDIGSEVGNGILRRIRETFFTSQTIGISDCFPVLRWIGYKGQEKNLKLLHKKRDELLQSLIDEIRGEKCLNDEKRKKSLIKTLLSLQVSEPEFYTDDVIKSILLVMFVAGMETAATALEWAMSLLLSHSDKLQELREEIDVIVGHDRLLDESDLSKLPYLRCIVNETLRLYPPTPLLLPHYSSQDCVVGGYDIPKGTTLLVNAWGVHRDPRLWEEPDTFDPGRFQAVEAERDGYKFVPFGMGRRACPGAGMALRMVSLALGAFVQCFDWEKLSEHKEMQFRYKSRITLQKVEPLEAVCIPRHEAAYLLSQL